MKTLIQTTLALFIISSYSLFPASAGAETYYQCKQGFEWQLNSNRTAVRCYRASTATVKGISCPNVTVPLTKRQIGTFPVAKSGRDKCKGSFTVGGVTQSTVHNPLPCPSGFSYRQNYQGNRDKCVKQGQPIVLAPNKEINQ